MKVFENKTMYFQKVDIAKDVFLVGGCIYYCILFSHLIENPCIMATGNIGEGKHYSKLL